MNVIKNLSHITHSLLQTTKFNHQIKGQKKAPRRHCRAGCSVQWAEMNAKLPQSGFFPLRQSWPFFTLFILMARRIKPTKSPLMAPCQ